jgi:acyl dehydratase
MVAVPRYIPAAPLGVGDIMAASWTPTDRTPVIYADLSGDRNPVHLDDDHARSAGFDGVIVHGMCVLATSARAAQSYAPEGLVLQSLDVRFAQPVLPGQVVDFDGSAKEREGRHKVGLDASIAGKRIMSPANFTFGAAGIPPEVPKTVDLDAHDEDVLGDPYRYSADQVASYRQITEPSDAVDSGVPVMTCMLGMTDALGKAFAALKPPERPGTWVHLRQSGVFYRPVEVDRDYVCRIQAGRRTVRPSSIGVMVTIPFVVETEGGQDLVSTGACVLLYAFDREDA